MTTPSWRCIECEMEAAGDLAGGHCPACGGAVRPADVLPVEPVAADSVRALAKQLIHEVLQEQMRSRIILFLLLGGMVVYQSVPMWRDGTLGAIWLALGLVFWAFAVLPVRWPHPWMFCGDTVLAVCIILELLSSIWDQPFVWSFNRLFDWVIVAACGLFGFECLKRLWKCRWMGGHPVGLGLAVVWPVVVVSYVALTWNTPSDYGRLVNRGRAAAQQDKWSEAEGFFSQAIAEDGQRAEAFVLRGVARYAQNQWAAAIPDFTRGIDLQGNEKTAYLMRGYCKQNLGDLDGALSDFTAAVNVHADHAEAYAARAGIRRVRGDIAGTFADASQAIKLDPNRAEAYGLRAWTHMVRGKSDEALRDFENCFRLRPELRARWEKEIAQVKQKLAAP